MVKCGDRAELEGCRVTVRFSGQLSGKDGHWVGVEWDDATKGKHDGALEGQQYFTCSRPGPCGSFIKLESFQKKALQGCSLQEALRDRYSSTVRDQDIAQGQSSRHILTAGEKSLAVQLLEHQRVQDRQADLQQLERATLIGAGVATVVKCLVLLNLLRFPNAADWHLILPVCHATGRSGRHCSISTGA